MILGFDIYSIIGIILFLQIKIYITALIWKSLYPKKCTCIETDNYSNIIVQHVEQWHLYTCQEGQINGSLICLLIPIPPPRKTTPTCRISRIVLFFLSQSPSRLPCIKQWIQKSIELNILGIKAIISIHSVWSIWFKKNQIHISCWACLRTCEDTDTSSSVYLSAGGNRKKKKKAQQQSIILSTPLPLIIYQFLNLQSHFYFLNTFSVSHYFLNSLIFSHFVLIKKKKNYLIITHIFFMFFFYY